ncbi:protein lethal(3)malignant blood neoplasm 1 [Bombus pascuorum]|uniref:protein lethal(3)malignant blood neoplasm 1 n=1 Tax=Bombus pascuorum TaxID=65598 RepID=UPI00298E3C5C|nr:protein lethal(3)malignant blood neoplasm 1 [Bombus pascuorum]
MCLLCAIILWNFAMTSETAERNRPYEFGFNIVDFQHRYEKKDANGIITGEYGFITADGVYHETGYATDKNGDFIITRMTYRRIKSLKDAQEILKARPEIAKKLVEAVARACSACKLVTKTDESERTMQTIRPVTLLTSSKKLDALPQGLANTLEMGKKRNVDYFADEISRERNEISRSSKDFSNERRGKNLVQDVAKDTVDPRLKEPNIDDRMPANDLYYRFNYSITTHEHQEDGYRSGGKNGSFRAESENGIDTRVKYLSNEFGHQPNVSFVARDNATKLPANESQQLKGYSFLWYWT